MNDEEYSIKKGNYHVFDSGKSLANFWLFLLVLTMKDWEEGK
jgi:hypothetical protein